MKIGHKDLEERRDRKCIRGRLALNLKTDICSPGLEGGGEGSR